MTTERDRKNQLAYAEAKGVEKGMEKARMQVARSLRELGVSLDIIQQSTGLSPEELAAL